MKQRAMLAILAGCCLTFTAASALAEYPTRTINMMIPFSAGGGTDVPGRFFAAEMETILGKNIVVSNVTGAGGTIGATQLSKAKPDGYKLGFMPVGTTTTQPHLRKTSYNGDSWETICLVSQGSQFVFVAPDSGIKSMDDLIAKAKEGKLTAGGAPPGSIPHIATMAIANAYGVKIKYIPHEGVNEAAKSMLGGRIDMTVHFSDSQDRFGVTPLVVLDSKRSEQLPDVPAIAELGKDVESFVWFGFFAPAGTPAEVVKTLGDACGQAVKTASFIDNMTKAKRDIRYMGTDEFTSFFKRQYEQNGQLLKEAGLIK